MDFGSLLRLLLTLNDIKMYNLADALGYDKSYLSKWINHTKLPSAKEIDRLADSIAEFVTLECGNDRKRITARELGFAKKDGNAPEDSAFTAKLSELLKEAYWRSRHLTKTGEKNPSTVRESMAPARRVKRMEEMECILATQPVTRNGAFQSALEDFPELDMANMRLKLLALIDLERFAGDIDLYWKHICRLLSLGSNADVELIETMARSDLPDRLLIAKEQFVIQSLTLPFSDKTVSLRVTDPAVVDLYYDDARRFLQRQQFVLESSNTNGNLYYYKYAGTSEKKRYLLSSMFPIYMSEELFGEILDKYGNNKISYPRQYLNEFAAEKSVVIFDSALLRYMSTGKISALDAYEGETLTKSERRQHLQGIIDELEDGSRLEMMILSDKNPILNYDDISVSFFMNNSSAYCSDIHKKKDGVRYFVSSDCRKHLGAFLDHIHGLSEEHLTNRKQTIDYIYNGMKNM